MDLKEQERIRKQAEEYSKLKNLKEKMRYIELSTEDKRRKINRIIYQTVLAVVALGICGTILFFWGSVIYNNFFK